MAAVLDASAAGTAAPAPTLGFGQLVRTGAALAAAGAGIVHLDAARDHAEHPHIVAFFVGVAVLQLAWAASMARRECTTRMIAAGLALNGAVLATWAVSRSVGLPELIPGAGGVEEIGQKDLAASGLELATLAAAAFAVVMPAAAAAVALPQRAGERMVRAIAAAVMIVTVPGVLASHTHDHGAAAHTHDAAAETDGHTHPDGEVAAGDGHDHAATTTGTDGHDHTTTSAVDSHDGHDAGSHDHGTAASASEPGHVHAEIIDGHGAETHTHDHALAPAAGAVLGPQLPGPLEGPGNVSTLRIGPIPLLPTIPLINMPHLSPAIPFVGPGRVNVLPLAGLPAPCTDCYVLGIEPDLVYADGSPANLDTGPMLHHVVFSDMTLDDPVCGRDTAVGQIGRRLFAAGNERTGARLPDGFGMPLTQGLWGGVAELMNHSTSLKVVFVEATVRWLPMSTPDIAPVTPVWMDIDSCGDSEFNVAQGATDTTWDWTSNLTGRVVTAGGHLHDGGTWLRLANTTTGENVCTSVAGYGTKAEYRGSIESMSTCSWDRLSTLRSGDVLRLDAHYNTSAPTQNVMGIMMIFVYETDDVTGGTASPYDATAPTDGAPADAGHHH